MAGSLNRVTISGNLTRDPETREVGDTTVTELGVAVNDHRKVKDEWVDVANFFDVTVWGARGEALAKYLHKGSGVIVDGKLRWESWEAEDGSKRSKVKIIAEDVVWLPKAAQAEADDSAEDGDDDPGF